MHTLFKSQANAYCLYWTQDISDCASMASSQIRISILKWPNIKILKYILQKLNPYLIRISNKFAYRLWSHLCLCFWYNWKSLWDLFRPWKRSLKSQSRSLIPTPLPHNKFHLVNIEHHVEEIEVGIDSTIEGSFVVALDSHEIGYMTIPMHISREVAQIIEVVVTGVVIILSRWAHGGSRKKEWRRTPKC